MGTIHMHKYLQHDWYLLYSFKIPVSLSGPVIALSDYDWWLFATNKNLSSFLNFLLNLRIQGNTRVPFIVHFSNQYLLLSTGWLVSISQKERKKEKVNLYKCINHLFDFRKRNCSIVFTMCFAKLTSFAFFKNDPLLLFLKSTQWLETFHTIKKN